MKQVHHTIHNKLKRPHIHNHTSGNDDCLHGQFSRIIGRTQLVSFFSHRVFPKEARFPVVVRIAVCNESVGENIGRRCKNVTTNEERNRPTRRHRRSHHRRCHDTFAQLVVRLGRRKKTNDFNHRWKLRHRENGVRTVGKTWPSGDSPRANAGESGESEEGDFVYSAGCGRCDDGK